MRHPLRILTALWAIMTILVAPVSAQRAADPMSLGVFLDCQYFCDLSFIKESLPVVDWLNERTRADVHILVAAEGTGAGGRRTTLTFLGQHTYAALADTLIFATSADATRDEERQAMVHHLSIGLAHYLARAGISERLRIVAVLPKRETATASIASDPWDYWVFSLHGSGYLNGQESTTYLRRSFIASANRTTEKLKMRAYVSLYDNISKFEIGDETIRNEQSSESFATSVVHSIGEHWAIGAAGNMSGSSVSNAKRIIGGGPAIEYNFFPYSQSTRKYLTVQYDVMWSHRRYDELTIFALEEENVLSHALDVTLSLNQKWGSVSFSADLNHLLTNFDRQMTDLYRLGFYTNLDVRLFRGFSLTAYGSHSRIRDQIDLPGQAATREEILLQSKRLPSKYSYSGNLGITYRFGSVFNNVVNPRLRGF